MDSLEEPGKVEKIDLSKTRKMFGLDWIYDLLFNARFGLNSMGLGLIWCILPLKGKWKGTSVDEHVPTWSMSLRKSQELKSP